MLKMVGIGRRGDRPIKLVIFGLSHMNLARLKEGKPISFPGEDVGLPNVEFLIFSGETEQSMQREFADMIGPGTKFHMDRRLGDA